MLAPLPQVGLPSRVSTARVARDRTTGPMDHGATRRLLVYSRDSTSRRGPDARAHVGNGSPNAHGDEILWTRGVEESGRVRQAGGPG
jgi:hypothetical protein